MQPIVYSVAPLVNPARLPVPTVAEQALADRLAHAADGGDPDDYRPEWGGDGPYVPTLAERYEETGRSIGLAGGNCAPREAFPGDSGLDWIAGERAFYRGLLAGRKLFAERVGHALGLDGEPPERPASVHRRFDAEFGRGWGEGAAERASREAEMAAYFQQLDWEHEHEMEMREVDRLNREACGWARAALVRGGAL